MRTIVVTGGGTGIGKAIAQLFSTSGDEVFITGRRADPLTAAAQELGSTVHAVAFDASEPAQVHAALDTLPTSVDVLVNNAGGNTALGAAEPADLVELAATWNANLSANLLSAVLVTAALRDRLAPGGAVVSIGSLAAHRGGTGSYGAAKAALEAWNLTLARDVGADRITANVIAPGAVEATEFFGGAVSPQGWTTLASQTATGRVATPDDIAATAYFLASPGARHITGQTVHVNGGV